MAKLLRFPNQSRQDDTDDATLVEHIQRGDQQAWAAFLARYTDLIYHKARQYSQTVPNAEREDETAELYLFMAQTVRRSLKSFRGTCKTRTWILSVIGNRPHVLKAYLLHKDPARADVRLPRVLTNRSPTEQEIFRRLVWGLDPAHIARELDVSPGQCFAVENLLAENSPRVYERIQANRQAQSPTVSLESGEAASDTPVQLAHPGPDPAEQTERQHLQSNVRQALQIALDELTAAERRVLVLLYNQGLAPAQIAALAADENLGLGEAVNANRCYYLKDRALDKIAAQIVAQLGEGDTDVPTTETRRERLKQVETFLREQGIPLLARE